MALPKRLNVDGSGVPLTLKEAAIANRTTYGPAELRDFPPSKAYVSRDKPPKGLPPYNLACDGCPIVIYGEVFCRKPDSDGVTICGHRKQRSDLIKHLKSKHGVDPSLKFEVGKVGKMLDWYRLAYVFMMENEEYEGKIEMGEVSDGDHGAANGGIEVGGGRLGDSASQSAINDFVQNMEREGEEAEAEAVEDELEEVTFGSAYVRGAGEISFFDDAFGYPYPDQELEDEAMSLE